MEALIPLLFLAFAAGLLVSDYQNRKAWRVANQMHAACSQVIEDLRPAGISGPAVDAAQDSLEAWHALYSKD